MLFVVARSSLWHAYCGLFVVCCLLCLVRFVLFVVCCVLFAVYCSLCVVRCVLPVCVVA